MALGTISFSGLASGLDVESIISAIMKAERRPVDQLESRQTLLDARRTALQDFSSKLSSLRSALLDVASPTVLSARTATTSDSSVVTATASSSADVGVHSVQVTAVAKAHRVRSESVASRYDAAVADGTITLRSGGRDPVTIDVSAASGDNTLVSIRDRINAADAGIVATVVNDGSGDLLVVRAASTGTANALTITDTTSLALAAPGNVLDVAANASLVVDGIQVTSATNTVTTAVSGVTLQLVSPDPGVTVDVTVANDTTRVKDGIKKFVDAYNAVAGALRSQFTADATTGYAGVLAGDSLLRRAQDMLQSAVSGGVAGLPPAVMTTLGSMGVAIEGSSGNLRIDDAKLATALDERFDQVSSLLGVAGRASDSSVVWSAASSSTAAGTYAVGVTRAAERAFVSGSAALSPSGLAASESLTIGLGSAQAVVTLAAGDTISAVVTKINAALATAGVGVRASSDGGRLRLASVDYGMAMELSVVSSVSDPADGSTTGIGTTTLSDVGEDIAGTLNGVAAIGVGNVLTATDGTAAAGLSVTVYADAAAVAARAGDFGTVTVTRGVADTLARDLKTVVEPIGGLIANVVSGIDDEKRQILDRIADYEERLREREAFLTIQFGKAEQAIQSLQQQQAALGNSYSLI